MLFKDLHVSLGKAIIEVLWEVDLCTLMYTKNVYIPLIMSNQNAVSVKYHLDHSNVFPVERF